MRPVHRTATWTTALGVAALVAGARADLDVVVKNGDVIRGTLLPADEQETWRIDAPAGAKLSASLRSGPARATLALQLFDPFGVEVASVGGRSAKLRHHVIATSGGQSLVVTSADGLTSDDYQLSVTWKSPTKFAKTIAVDAHSVAGFQFAADAGADVVLALAPLHKSKAVPSAARVSGARGSSVELAGGVKATFHADVADTYTLLMENAGDVAGAVKATAKVRAPKPGKRFLSATTRDIPPGTTVVAAAVMDAGGGRLDAPGTGVTVNAGALAAPAIVVLGQVPDIVPTKPADSVKATNAVLVGPFARSLAASDGATVDLSFTQAGTPPDGSSLRVYAADDPSAGQELPTSDVHGSGGGVSFSATKFTRFQAYYVKQPDLLPPFALLGDEKTEEFGRAVAVSGTFVYAGSPGRNGPAGEASAGAVRIFERVGPTWIERTAMREPTPGAGDRFGEEIKIVHGSDGQERLVVSAPLKTVGAYPGQGAVYVFVGSGASWTLETTLGVTPDEPNPSQIVAFGRLMAADADTILVTDNIHLTAQYELTRGATGWTTVRHAGLVAGAQLIRGDESFWGVAHYIGGPGLNQRTELWVWGRTAGVWSNTQQILDPANAQYAVGFATDIAVDGDSMIVGSPDDGLVFFGSKDASGWTVGPAASTVAPQPIPEGLGQSVALQGDTAVESGYLSPRARVFTRTSGVWQESLFLDPSPTLGATTRDSRIALDGKIIVIGASQAAGPYDGESGPGPGGIAIYRLP